MYKGRPGLGTYHLWGIICMQYPGDIGRKVHRPINPQKSVQKGSDNLWVFVVFCGSFERSGPQVSAVKKNKREVLCRRLVSKSHSPPKGVKM